MTDALWTRLPARRKDHVVPAQLLDPYTLIERVTTAYSNAALRLAYAVGEGLGASAYAVVGDRLLTEGAYVLIHAHSLHDDPTPDPATVAAEVARSLRPVLARAEQLAGNPPDPEALALALAALADDCAQATAVLYRAAVQSAPRLLAERLDGENATPEDEEGITPEELDWLTGAQLTKISELNRLGFRWAAGLEPEQVGHELYGLWTREDVAQEINLALRGPLNDMPRMSYLGVYPRSGRFWTSEDGLRMREPHFSETGSVDSVLDLAEMVARQRGAHDTSSPEPRSD